MFPRSAVPADVALRYHSAVKTLLVDIDRRMLLHCLTRIGGRQPLTLATSKSQALELLHQGPTSYDVVVACERLEDGSGLALLSDVQVRWPNLLRVFCSERQRLAQVRNRLSAFRLRHTLVYPLRPTKLELLLVHLARTKAASTVRIRAPYLVRD
jgi:DNA-binding NtrC family response regulator